MNLILWSNVIVCVCAFLGFDFGVMKFIRPQKALYAQMITLRGKDGLFYVAEWSYNNFYYIVSISDNIRSGVTAEEMGDYISSVS